MLGEALSFGMPDIRIRTESRMIGFIGDVIEHPDEIRQQLHIAGTVLKAAGKTEFPRPMPSHFTDGNHHIPYAIPGTALLGIESVSAGSGVGEGSVSYA